MKNTLCMMTEVSSLTKCIVLKEVIAAALHWIGSSTAHFSHLPSW